MIWKAIVWSIITVLLFGSIGLFMGSMFGANCTYDYEQGGMLGFVIGLLVAILFSAAALEWRRGK